MEKKDFWPKEGKLKKGGIIFLIVVAGALLITLIEEKTQIKFTKKLPYIIAFACIGVWLYKPIKKTQ